MDVRMPNGVVVKNVPEGVTKAQLTEMLKAKGIGLEETQQPEFTTEKSSLGEYESVPQWGKDSPVLYGLAGAARQALELPLEVGGMLGGAILGTGATLPSGPGAIAGGVAGAGLGYASAKELIDMADIALGNKAPESMEAVAIRTAKNALTGATMEAGGRAVIQPVLEWALPIAAKVLGKSTDVLKSTVGGPSSAEIRAATIARESLDAGGQLPQARAALRQRPNIPASEALARNEFLELPTTQALLKGTEAYTPEYYMLREASKKRQGEQFLAGKALANTQEEALAAQAAEKRLLNQQTTPMREEALAAAEETNQLVPWLQTEAKLGRESAAESVDQVRRMEKAQEQALKHGLNEPIHGVYNQDLTGLAARGEEWGIKAAERSLDQGARARAAEDILAEMDALGIKPISGDSIASTILRKANDPSLAGSNAAKALKSIAREFQRHTTSGGIIHPEAAYSLRKAGITDTASRLAKGDQTAQKRLESKLLTELKPIIDDAINSASGSNLFSRYLDEFATGMKEISKRKLSAKLLDLYTNQPNMFAKVVKGGKPDLIQKYLGPNDFRLLDAFDQPSATTLKEMAADITAKVRAGEQASEGVMSLAELMEKHKGFFHKRTLPTLLDVRATAAQKAMEILERRMSNQTAKVLVEKAKNAGNLDQLLNILPAKERLEVLKELQSKQFAQSPVVQGINRAIAIGIGDNYASGGIVRPRSGHIEDGYLFMGGDPSDSNNWVKA